MTREKKSCQNEKRSCFICLYLIEVYGLNEYGFLFRPLYLDANALIPSQKQKVIVEIPAEALQAAASGHGTTLGQAA